MVIDIQYCDKSPSPLGVTPWGTEIYREVCPHFSDWRCRLQLSLVTGIIFLFFIYDLKVFKSYTTIS